MGEICNRLNPTMLRNLTNQSNTTINTKGEFYIPTNLLILDDDDCMQTE